MDRIKKYLKQLDFRHLLYSFVLVFFSLFSIFAPYATVQAAGAEDITKNVPLTSDDKPAGWLADTLKIKFINRSHIKVNFDAGSENPLFTDAGRAVTFEDVFAGEYVDDDWDGQEQNVQYDRANGNGGDKNQSRLNSFGGNLNDLIDPGSGDNFIDFDLKLTNSQIQSNLRGNNNGVNLLVETARGFFEDIGCSVWLVTTNDAPDFSKWVCQDDASGPNASDIHVRSYFEDIERFNISYAYRKADDKVFSLLYMGESKSYSFCPERGGGANGLYVQGDCGGKDYLVLEDGSRAVSKTDLESISDYRTFGVKNENGDVYKTVIAADGSAADTLDDDPDSGAGGGGSGRDDEEDCDAESGLTWIICGTVRLVRDALEKAGTVIEDLLLSDPKVVQQGSPAYRSWKGFRDLANVGLVLVFVIIIYSQATGGKS